jgi:two-component system chemotaxis sensor kinase CheA
VTENKNLKLQEAILVVDDEPGLQEMLKEQIQTLGYRCICSSNGSEALSKLREDTFFLVLTDLNMPVMNGMELARQIRETNPLLPIVMMTAFGEKDLVIEAMRTGIYDFVEKPFSLDAIEKIASKVANIRLIDIEREQQELEDLRGIFIEEAQGVLTELEALISGMDEGSTDINQLNLIYRKVHTLKGSAGTIPNASNLVKLAHVFETSLTGLKEDKLNMTSELHAAMVTAVDSLNSCVQCLASKDPLPDTTSIQQTLDNFNQGKSRVGAVAASTLQAKSTENKPISKSETSDDGVVVSSDKLESLKELSGELVAFKNTFNVFLKQNAEALEQQFKELMDMDRILFKLTDQLQTEINDIQQVTLGKTFSKFPRIVRQVSGELGKQIKLQLIGQDMTVDRIVSRALGDALIHAVRNSCDHGIETPEQRAQSGKHRQGVISIKGSMIGDLITIEIFDDGGGLNRDRILKKALEKDLIKANEINNIPDSEVWDLLFLPNFSTASQVSNISGRGVGMDVVKTVATKFGGNAWFDTVAGQSTTLTIQFPTPRSLVVEQSIVAASGDISLAIPLNAINEIRSVAKEEMSYLKPFWTFQHRGSTVPVGNYLMFVNDPDVPKDARINASVNKDSLVAILNHQGKFVGLQLDSIVDQLEAVIRPFNEVIGRICGFKGVSRLPGDGIAYVVSSEDAIRNIYDLTKSNQRASKVEAA